MLWQVLFKSEMRLEFVRFDKGIRPVWRRVWMQAEPDRAVEDCWQGYSTCLTLKANTSKIRQNSWKLLTRAFSPF